MFLFKCQKSLTGLLDKDNSTFYLKGFFCYVLFSEAFQAERLKCLQAAETVVGLSTETDQLRPCSFKEAVNQTLVGTSAAF